MGKACPILLSRVHIDKEIQKATLRALNSGHYILGKESQAFEEEFADYIGTKYAILTGSGTAALWLTLISLEVKAHDEIIVPSLTAFPTIEPILTIGANPVFVDITDTYTIDPSKIEEKISPKTKGIIPVHLYGHPANMNEIKNIARRHNLFILEDCCQAHGARFENKRVGSIGIAGCFSFYPSKNLTVCGDGGIVTTNNKSLSKTLRMLRDHGRSSKYTHSILGFNERFNEIQAAIGRVNLKKLDSYNEHRRQVALWYRKFLSGLPLELPQEKSWAYHVYHMFVIRFKERDKLKLFIESKNIGTGIHYPIPCHLQPAISAKSRPINLALTEEYCKEILSLPIYPMLTKKQTTHICNAINFFLHRQSEEKKAAKDHDLP
ncbi:MAG: hypothetical protein A2Y00_03185 [Omnitrophica WOR_2 bacterium GWF2_43_52]|nr:MAG: hypothetical protein A2Y00_03185 [Omnitrophica WOR_2 bacterium GWF2_43_52]OGX57645.1 MAG: hypothetical protein A2460_02695 [Omnitrophica WOR_2 bacterium RIFOXYC2_FULL_43_9]HAH20857.1 erythromycin biosynthesis sensory transduction protein eryC1 [Candidatus Omnitrophota bacterium]HBG64525.1 erythromycin biosynthesis sensory transduction protein eryC1 [Candidatus Omnitrophota bacterium]